MAAAGMGAVERARRDQLTAQVLGVLQAFNFADTQPQLEAPTGPLAVASCASDDFCEQVRLRCVCDGCGRVCGNVRDDF